MFLLKLQVGEANKIYSWCCKEFGKEFIMWKYFYGGGYVYSDGDKDQRFIIKSTEYIVLFELTWGELRSERDLVDRNPLFL